MTVPCPHQKAAARLCNGCDDPRTDDQENWTGLHWCEGEITARVYRDSEGDAGVIGGIHNFWATEDEEATCGCSLTDSEWDKVRELLVDGVINDEPDDPWLDGDN